MDELSGGACARTVGAADVRRRLGLGLGAFGAAGPPAISERLIGDTGGAAGASWVAGGIGMDGRTPASTTRRGLGTFRKT